MASYFAIDRKLGQEQRETDDKGACDLNDKEMEQGGAPDKDRTIA